MPVKTKKLKVTAESTQAVAQMNEALAGVFTAITKTLTSQNESEVLTRYELGKHILTVLSDTRKYGENAAALLAEAIGVSETYLHNVKQLYSQWKDNYKVFKSLVTQRMSTGMSLTYSHFVYINTIPTDTGRVAMANRCLKECLTTEELKTIMLGEFGNRSNNTGSISPRNPTAGVAVMLKALEKLGDSHDKIQKSIFERIAKAPETFANDKTVEKLQELVTQIMTVREQLDRDTTKLAETIKLLTKDTAKVKSMAESGPEVDEDDDEDRPPPAPRVKVKLSKPAAVPVRPTEQKAAPVAVASADVVTDRLKRVQAARAAQASGTKKPFGLASV